MNIAIIGKGNVGQALKAGFERNGHVVRAAGQGAGEVADAGRFGEVIVFAVPFAAIDDVVAQLGDSVAGKVVVDATNVLTPAFELAVGFDTSGAEILQAKLPQARVIKAFNTSFSTVMETGQANGQQVSGLVAGDDAAAKETVLKLVGELGFDAVDAGPLANARLLEPLALLAIRLGLVQGFGPFIGFKLAR